MKLCKTCGISKPKTEFSPEKRSADRLAYRCRECNRERRRKARKKHAAYWDSRDPFSGGGNRNCRRCLESKPVQEFSRDRTAPDGLQRWCRRCHVREWQIRKFGVAPTDDDVCAICGDVGSLCVDHCHRTGKVRGFLCGRCNPALGGFRDDPALLREAALYIESSK
jgi:hypothetical protein